MLVIIMTKIPSKSGDVTVTGRISGSDGAIPLNDSDVHIRLPSSLFQQQGRKRINLCPGMTADKSE